MARLRGGPRRAARRGHRRRSAHRAARRRRDPVLPGSRGAPGVSDPPAPAVPSGAYDEEYFRTCCVGHDAWSASGGREFHPQYGVWLERAQLAPGEVVVDVGCSRGELVALAAHRGAAEAIGVDYSEAAVRLARHTIAA